MNHFTIKSSFFLVSSKQCSEETGKMDKFVRLSEDFSVFKINRSPIIKQKKRGCREKLVI